jgi:hypothetical protein
MSILCIPISHSMSLVVVVEEEDVLVVGAVKQPDRVLEAQSLSQYERLLRRQCCSTCLHSPVPLTITA